MPATESITIEIQGDSSGLSQALSDALAQVESLQSAAEGASSTASGIGGKLSSVSTVMQPLQLVGQQLTRISQQAQALSQQPISLNVQPALSALQSLMSAIQAVAAQLSALSMPAGGPGSGLGGGTSGPAPGLPAPRAAMGMSTSLALAPRPQSGMTSPDRSALTVIARSPIANVSPPQPLEVVTASSAAPQPILAQSAPSAPRVVIDAAHLPLRHVAPAPGHDSTPQSPLDARGVPRFETSFPLGDSHRSHSQSVEHSTSTTNHFGGITIEVKETADVNTLMRDLRLQGLALRHRQG